MINARKLAVCTYIKDNTKNLKEFIDYYLKLNFDNIYLFEDSENFSYKYIVNQYSQVSLHHINDIGILDNTSNDWQLKIYQYCVLKFKCQFDWIFICDINNYLIVENNYILNNVFNESKNETSISVYPKNSVESGKLYYETHFDDSTQINPESINTSYTMFINCHIISNDKLKKILNIQDTTTNNCLSANIHQEFPKCDSKGHIRIEFNPITNKVIFSKCFLKFGEIIRELSIEEYKNISIYDYCISIFKMPPVVKASANCPFVKICNYQLEETLDTIEVAISNACNLRCAHCYVKARYGNGIESKEIKDLYFKTLYAIKGKGLNSIRLTDHGEPFYYKEETLEYLKSLTLDDCKEVHFTTNGTLIKEEDIHILENVIPQCVITVSLDGVSDKSMKAIRHIQAEPLLNTIKALAKTKLNIWVNTVFQPFNYDEYVEIINFVKECNIQFTSAFYRLSHQQKQQIMEYIENAFQTNDNHRIYASPL